MFACKVLLLITLNLMAMGFVVCSPPDHCVGCIEELKGEELENAVKELETSLAKLAAGDGPTYQLVKVNSASVQVVSGSLHRFNVDLSDGDKTKTCDVELWSQPWLENGFQVTFNCPGEEQVVKKHN